MANQFRQYCLHESTDQGERLLDDVELPKTSVAQAVKLLETLQPDGSWTDVDYLSKSRSAWPPCDHLTRALALTVCARRPDTSPALAARCLAGVHQALSYWEAHDLQCANWWYNQIGVPKILGHVALLLNADLTDGEKRYITNKVLTRASVGSMTGQNRVWLAGIGVMRAALLSDDLLMRQATRVIQGELIVSTDEGIQPDWSFHQHGPQQQFGNYGMAYAVEMCRWATVLRGTTWAFSPEKTAILRNYLLNGMSWVIWRNNMDISACGRQLFPGSPQSKAGVVHATMRAMALADPDHAEQYRAFVSRNAEGNPNDLVGDQYFWRSDYLVHRRPVWMATLKMSSSRVLGGETVNDENLSGLLLADGATYFYQTGHEYDDIFPTWDWHMIPGVTSCLTDASLTWPKADLTKAPVFAGGASDGDFAIAAMDFYRDGLRAKKAWFFDHDQVICMGADIHSTNGEEVVTTINQCLLSGPATWQHGGSIEPLTGIGQKLEAVQWVVHNGLRYRPLEAEMLKATAGASTGNWNKVFTSPATPRDNVTKNLFKLWISHGRNPDGGTYSYMVEPTNAKEPHSAIGELRVISNSGVLQAIKTGNRTSAVFWQAGRADLDGMTIATSAPCMLMFDGSRLTVSDPTERLGALTITIDGNVYSVTLPHGGDAGSAITIDLKK